LPSKVHRSSPVLARRSTWDVDVYSIKVCEITSIEELVHGTVFIDLESARACTISLPRRQAQHQPRLGVELPEFAARS